MTEPFDHSAWYAIYCKPQAESLVLAQLQNKGIEGYLPLWQPAGRAGRVPGPKPYFPCYHFAHADLQVVGISALHYLPGVRHLVLSGGRPAEVPSVMIERIRQQLERQARAVTDAAGRTLVHGDPVRITGGPLAGFDAVFDCRLSSEQRVRILVNFIQKGTHVEIEREYIEKMNLAEWARRQVTKR